MIKILIGIIVSLGSVFLVIACLYFFFYPSKGILRIKELEQIKQTFSDNQKGTKRFIIGGSDVLYSFNTEKMNQELTIPTVNLGTNVGLGLGYLVDYGKKLAKPGDKIIACLAYSLYYNPPYHIFSFEYYRMFDKKKLTRFSVPAFIYYAIANSKYNFSYVQREFVIGESGCYLDVTGSQLPKEKEKALYFPENFNVTNSIRQLEEFKSYCLSHGIELYITYPSTLGFESYRNSHYLERLTSYLTENYQVIGKPEDYFVPLNHIFNSVYHINEVGQNFRTSRLINYLREKEKLYVSE